MKPSIVPTADEVVRSADGTALQRLGRSLVATAAEISAALA